MRQISPGGSWQINGKHTWVATDKLVVDSQFLYVHNYFNLDFQDYDQGCTFAVGGSFPSNAGCLFNTQIFTNRDTGVTGRSASASFFERPEWQYKSDANYFMSNFLGGDHSFKFGIAWRENLSNSYGHTGGFVTARYRTANGVYGPDSAIVSRDSFTKSGLFTTSAYAQDSYSRGKLRLTAGFRWDLQDDKIYSSCVPAVPQAPTLLAAQCTDDYDSPVNFNDISPRVSATYDLRGNGKTALKASYAEYFAQGVGTSGIRSNTGGVTLTYGPRPTSATTNGTFWNDANGDQIAQANEIGCTLAPGCLPTASTSRWNPATGQLDTSPNTIDPNLKNARTREFVTGFEHELFSNVGVGADYIWRKVRPEQQLVLQQHAVSAVADLRRAAQLHRPGERSFVDLLAGLPDLSPAGRSDDDSELAGLRGLQRRRDHGREADEPSVACGDIGHVEPGKTVQPARGCTRTRPTRTNRTGTTAATRTSAGCTSCRARSSCRWPSTWPAR